MYVVSTHICTPADPIRLGEHSILFGQPSDPQSGLVIMGQPADQIAWLERLGTAVDDLREQIALNAGIELGNRPHGGLSLVPLVRFDGGDGAA